MTSSRKTDLAKQIIESLEKAAKGDYAGRLSFTAGDNELGAIAGAVNACLAAAAQNNAESTRLKEDAAQKAWAERSVQERDKQLGLIADHTLDIIWTADLNWRLTYVSPSVLPIAGVRPDDLLGESIQDILPPDARSKAQALLDSELACAHSGSQHPAKVVFKTQITKKNKERFWAEVSAELHLDENGAPLEIVGVARDITRQKQTEEMIKANEKRYRLIIENMHDSISTMDLELNLTYVSPSEIRFSGFTPDEAIALPFNQMMTPASYALAERMLADAFDREFGEGASRAPQPSVSVELEMYHKDGHTFWQELTAYFHRDAHGRPFEIVLVGRKITEQKAMEMALRESEQRYRMIVENIHEIILTTDLDLNCTYVSPSCKWLTGYTPADMENIPMDRLLTPESFASAKSALASALAREAGGPSLDSHRIRTVEMELNHKNGDTLWLEVSATFSRSDTGRPTGILLAGRDITARRRAVEEKEKLARQLLQAQKMETVGRLAGGVAHDFNNMLSVILGYVDLAKMRLPQQHPVLRDITEIEKAAIRSRDITAQLLAFSRKQIIAPKIINLNDLVSHTQKALVRLIGEDVQFKYAPGKDLWAIKLDPSQVEQILMNLAVNARDAMPAGGKLTLETANCVLDAAYCRAHIGAKPGYYVQLCVSDNGVGMNKDMQQNIFEPFFTTKEAGKGTGLGLATVYGIVKQNDGFISVYSEPGQGTTFTIYFPRTTEIKIADQAIPEEPVFSATGNIVLVEDDGMVLEATKNMLESIGYAVTVPQTPQEAITLCQDRATCIDLVITDVVMPVMSGRELRDKLVEIRPDIKVLFMSGYTADAIARHGILEEGVQFLQKPFSLRNLVCKVNQAMAAN